MGLFEDIDRDYQQVALELARKQLPTDGRLRLRVAGSSMLPLLHPGDQVDVNLTPENLNLGDLVVIQIEEQSEESSGNIERLLPITHRLVGKDPSGWRTKGDACFSLDPTPPHRVILGLVVGLEREGRTTDFRSNSWRAASRWLGRLGWWEAKAYRVGGRFAAWPFKLAFRTILAGME